MVGSTEQRGLSGGIMEAGAPTGNGQGQLYQTYGLIFNDLRVKTAVELSDPCRSLLAQDIP